MKGEGGGERNKGRLILSKRNGKNRGKEKRDMMRGKEKGAIRKDDIKGKEKELRETERDADERGYMERMKKRE